MNVWKCDVCGIETRINPKTEPLFEEREVQIPVDQNKMGGPTKKVKQRVPKMTVMKKQDMSSGEVKEIQVQEHKDLEERAMIVKLRVGPESVQRDFCRKCLEDYAGEELRTLWKKLETVKAK